MQCQYVPRRCIPSKTLALAQDTEFMVIGVALEKEILDSMDVK